MLPDGSSPQARGAPSRCRGTWSRRSAHPRRRGEHFRSLEGDEVQDGSSPQARGAHPRAGTATPGTRLIPAGAGSTCASGPGPGISPAHPRRRGEHMKGQYIDFDGSGSSPQARGARPSTTNGSRPRRAHPRRRGEHSRATFAAARPTGSSPQARGALRLLPHVTVDEGLIPAGAGSTRTVPLPSPPSWAHPRRRGEHDFERLFGSRVPGSSPQARGARQPARHVRHGVGLIPAGAGSTAAAPGRGSSPRAHPRRRGEHRLSWENHASSRGSSPQARGALPHQVRAILLARLIPAGAGSTIPLSARDSATEAHPRRRGEHVGMTCIRPRASGSSPQARGALTDALWCPVVAGLIPAGAGSTSTIPVASPRIRAHLRPDFARSTGDCGLPTDTGSSPQARGARTQGGVQPGGHGLIPAGAGSTPANKSPPPHPRAHPRRRGEHPVLELTDLGCLGSSPQARGAQPCDICSGVRVRLIPAGAGSTTRWTTSRARSRAHPRRRGEHL